MLLFFILTDIEEPTLTCVDGKTTDTDRGKPTARVTWVDLQAEDNSGDVSVFCVPPSGTHFDIGLTTVTCNAVDGSGNKIACDFHVDVTGILTLDSYLTCSNQLCYTITTYKLQ